MSLLTLVQSTPPARCALLQSRVVAGRLADKSERTRVGSAVAMRQQAAAASKAAQLLFLCP
jgi:hypothetical protein